ncbi:beta-lactamase family protein [Dyella sp. LX-66]|uniref:serine hydrolase domain-containing protein n=1 Tax=unclassified Dyella TaxID=2634549 RepID=UPI001BE0FE47|nr:MULTISPECIES: serine hydrolase domain-containing protein [unclassified Dyella]MBT2118559.1 beta-lactamase family protein [Dyella sp. LX-1]MBT2142030.1 beta-lactamase family protein [Dyella sp. LX-66]
MKTPILAIALALAAGTAAAKDSPATNLDTALASFAGPANAPGCAVGVQSGDGTPEFRAFGTADLEHAVPIGADTVFEAGSVSKQFTAAATLILVSEGKLSLDDDVRNYLPELPDYGHPITIAQLLGHTSGLRDWGELEAIAGWPRTERVYAMADVLDITARQRALNFAPGTAWSYTNTGFNLLAMIVQRVSGASFVDFTRDRLFKPLGMAHTQWRDDFRRIVPGRAMAYEQVSDGVYQQLMPFENTYGHGALLTTVSDLLRWNQALTGGKLGAAVTQALQTRTLLSDGRPTVYARGLFLSNYHGMREIAHDGSTAGYRTWLGRYPDQHLSIALLCNSDDAIPSNYAHAIVDRYLPEAKPESHRFTTTPPSSLAGIYASERDGSLLKLDFHDGKLRTGNGLVVMAGPHDTLAFERKDGRVAMTGAVAANGRIHIDREGDATFFARQQAYSPAPAELARIAGRFHSAEVPVTYRITATKQGLQVIAEDRPGEPRLFVPAYTNAFISDDTVLRPVFNAQGEVTGIRISDGRVWDLPLARLPATP